MEKEPLNVKLRKGRTKLGWSQKTASEAFGVSQAYVSLIEKGSDTPSPKLLESMIREYGLDKAEIIDLYLITPKDPPLTPVEKEWLRALRERDLAAVRRFIKHYFTPEAA
jgi:transcriptional regulator with XRE-family HTH domain